MTEAWATVEAELDRAFEAGRRLRIWLRDDDCVAVTPALERLASLCHRFDLAILLAVIPELAEPGLAEWIAAHPAVTPCQHGFAHRNHAAPGERARELGGRPVEAVLDDLARGRAILQALFGDRLSDILVPPWNRIDADLVSWLPGLGYSALSTFGPPQPDAVSTPELRPRHHRLAQRPRGTPDRRPLAQTRRAHRARPSVVMAGLVPATHAERRREGIGAGRRGSRSSGRRGWPGQARP